MAATRTRSKAPTARQPYGPGTGLRPSTLTPAELDAFWGDENDPGATALDLARESDQRHAPIDYPRERRPWDERDTGDRRQPNRYGGRCTLCQAWVEPEAGYRWREGGGWVVEHRPGTPGCEPDLSPQAPAPPPVAPSPAPSAPGRTNRFAADCVTCGARVPAETGSLTKGALGWEVRHHPVCPEPEETWAEVGIPSEPPVSRGLDLTPETPAGCDPCHTHAVSTCTTMHGAIHLRT